MTILGYNPEQISSQAPVSVEVLSERVLKAKREVDGVLGKMKNDLLKRKRKKGIIEEVALMCEKIKYGITLQSFAKLIQKTGDINAIDEYSLTILMSLAFKNYIEIMKLILTHPDIQVNKKDMNNTTALIFGAKDTQTTKILLTHPEILVNEENSEGYTALIKASERGNIESVQALIEDPRLDLQEHDQGKKALKATENEEIRTLIKAKMREQGIEV